MAWVLHGKNRTHTPSGVPYTLNLPHLFSIVISYTYMRHEDLTTISSKYLVLLYYTVKVLTSKDTMIVQVLTTISHKLW